ncbi:MAG TPA: hypothetical protein VIE39_10630 [Thermoanaerobaculia bacterium]|jgi:hypothetical protein
MRVRVIVGLVAALCCACGKSHRAGRSPKETMRNLEAALQDADMGAVYDMLSAQGQAEIEASLGGFRAALAAVPEAQLKAAGIAGFRKMSARDMLVAACEKAEDMNPKALEPLKSLTIVVTDVRQSGDRATVKTSVLLRGRAHDETVVLVRESGLWKLDGNGLLSDLPVPTTPALPSCSGPAP